MRDFVVPDTVYLAVSRPAGPGDDLRIDDIVYEYASDAVARARELGPSWSVESLPLVAGES